jgi:hypothetical protein
MTFRLLTTLPHGTGSSPLAAHLHALQRTAPDQATRHASLIAAIMRRPSSCPM